MSKVRNIYRALRGILFTAVATAAALWLVLYILLSLPPVQNYIKGEAEKELSKLLTSPVEIKDLSISPFNELTLRGVTVNDRSGKECLTVSRIGAGIRLWQLIHKGRIEISYAEITGLDARIYQSQKDEPLNIAFIIDAFKPKDKNKPPSKFDLNIHRVVLRRVSVSFDKMWEPQNEDSTRIDFNHLRLHGLRADLVLPRISDHRIEAELKRMSFSLNGLEVTRLTLSGSYTPQSIGLDGFSLSLPNSTLNLNPIKLKFKEPSQIIKALETGNHIVKISDSHITPSDLSPLLPALQRLDTPISLQLSASGNAKDISLQTLSLEGYDGDLAITIEGNCSSIADRETRKIGNAEIKLHVGRKVSATVMELLPTLSPKLREIISKMGNMSAEISGNWHFKPGNGSAQISLHSGLGNLKANGIAHGVTNGKGTINAGIDFDNIETGIISGQPKLGQADGSLNGEIFLRKGFPDGNASLELSRFQYLGRNFGAVSAEISKEGNEARGSVSLDNDLATAEIDFNGKIENTLMEGECNADIPRFRPALVGMKGKYEDYEFSGKLNLFGEGTCADDITGHLALSGLDFSAPGQASLALNSLTLDAYTDSIGKQITLRSDWLDGSAKGDFKIKDILPELKSLAATVFPALLPPVSRQDYTSDIGFSLTLKPDNSWTEFLKMPFRLLVPVPVSGGIDATANRAWLTADIPYLQQGKNKLVRATSLSVRLDGDEGSADLNARTTFPAKKGDMNLLVGIAARDNSLFADLGWDTPSNSSFNGRLLLGAEVGKNEISGKPNAVLDINPSQFVFGTAKWNVDKGSISYDEGTVRAEGIKVWHDRQFVEIDGTASASPLDTISVRLADIDLDYVFETLNINYVNFGGTATGEVTASGAFGPEPVAKTDSLYVKGLCYNGALLGDAILRSHWDNDRKMVAIGADITSDEGRPTTLDGGIWVTRDSLSFDVEADRVPIGFLQPFMAAFSSKVEGRASGKAKLFGTFSDIDLCGKLFADSIALKLDYTNVTYHGTDSVTIDPGKIVIPAFRLYDRNGRSAILSGELTHRYFHDPRFTFRVSDARRLLVYDTDRKINPDWYGTLYGNGGAVVRGWPGSVGVSVDMTVVGDSRFTFVLNDSQAASDYRFLTFSDRRKEEAERLRADTVPDILAAFQKKQKKNDDKPSKFSLDIRGSVTPSALFTLVMDPIAGDKITARGQGDLQVEYDTESDEMQMFGKYTLDEGTYNFSLQDIILRDFAIRRGSNISFNGDPLDARLDITAAYRVNTNLSDLDKSFSTDRELARTNVPVDALLSVNGPMQSPDITFDIELPTLTQDVERKVKSIISTDDMMSRQIIYLLALNRFYTPEYMGASSNGSEFASVASSTLSSQLSSMLGQLTDKFTVAPSFRSDKGDFSDLEVDVALSSRLLNNRLLVNGNFGYRDKNTSTTTFVGDFDIEYLLNRNGNLRLKAYNHFNDQNYYLRQALTTQGLGIIFRKDFDNPFKKKKE